jgi:hypothetical protein
VAIRSKRSQSRSREVPWTARPLTPAQLRAIEAGRAAIRRGDFVTLEEAEAYVARQRAKPHQGGRHKVRAK